MVRTSTRKASALWPTGYALVQSFADTPLEHLLATPLVEQYVHRRTLLDSD